MTLVLGQKQNKTKATINVSFQCCVCIQSLTWTLDKYFSVSVNNKLFLFPQFPVIQLYCVLINHITKQIIWNFHSHEVCVTFGKSAQTSLSYL